MSFEEEDLLTSRVETCAIVTVLAQGCRLWCVMVEVGEASGNDGVYMP